MLIPYLKKLLLVHVPTIIPRRYLIRYWILLSLFQALLTNRQYIKSITKCNSEISNDLYLIKASDGEILIQNVSRIPRFISGKNYALNRLYLQYTNKLFLMKDVENLDRELVFFDIGANIGEFSMALAQKFESCKIFAFEPDPVAFHCLKYNIAASRMSGYVFILNIALSDKSGLYPFYISTKNADSSFIEPKDYTEIVKVQSLRADEFMKVNLIECISLLKMDAEGFEPEVISGFGDRITDIKFFAIDVGPERYGQDTAIEIEQLLEPRGMEVKVYLQVGKRKFLNAYWK
jgi:FkbM family methyltransferase